MWKFADIGVKSDISFYYFYSETDFGIIFTLYQSRK